MKINKTLKSVGLTVLIGAISVYLCLHLVAFLMPALNINSANGLYFYDSIYLQEQLKNGLILITFLII